jgi:hypothetical protein
MQLNPLFNYNTTFMGRPKSLFLLLSDRVAKSSLRKMLPLASLLLGSCWPVVSCAQLPSVELQSLSLQVLPIGSSTELKLEGSRLDELSQVLLTDFAGTKLPQTVTIKTETAKPLREDLDTTGIVELKVDASVVPGLAELRSLGRFGISNPRAVLLSSLPVEISTTGHHSLATAKTVKPDHLINGRVSPQAVNYYRFQVSAGQTLRGVGYCKQLDSLAELNVRILSSAGSPLASARSIGQWPAELNWTNSSNTPQDVLLEVRDILYRGGANFNYVLQVRVGGPEDSARPLELDNWLRPRLTLPLNPAKFSNPAAASLVARGWNSATELSAIAAGSTVETLPARFIGDLKEKCALVFKAEKDQSLSFEVASSSLDQLTDPALIIYKVNTAADGTVQLQQLAEQDDAAYLGTPAVRIRQRDPQLLWKAPETAIYQLHLIDRQSGLRPADSRNFVLEIRPATPSFWLIAHEPFPTNAPANSKPWGSQLSKLGSQQFHVSLMRLDGFNGAVELKIEGLPAGCRADPVIAPAGATEADLVVQAPVDLALASANIGIVGTAQLGETLISSRAIPAAIIHGTQPTFTATTWGQASQLPIATVISDTAPLQVQLGEGKTIEVPAGEKFSLPIKLLRQPAAAAECTLRPQALPAKVGLGETKIAGDKADAAPEITVAADAAVGEYTFWLQTETKVKWRANPQQLEREEAYNSKLKSTLEANSTGDIPREQVEAALAKSTARVEELKKQTVEQEYTIFVPSNPVRLKIVPKP